jgi:hypothetical protein
MSTGMQAPRSKLQEDHPLLWSDGTAVSRSDERVDEAGFEVSGQASGSGWRNASVPMLNTSSLPVPTRLSYSLVSHILSQVVEMSEKFYSRLGTTTHSKDPRLRLTLNSPLTVRKV